MTFPVVWLMPDVPRAHNDSRHRLTWAQAQTEAILTELGGDHRVGFDELADDEVGAAVVIPAEYYADRDQVDWLNVQVNNLDWAVVFLTSDEASQFPAGRLEHRLDRMRVWVQTPHPHRHIGIRYLPFGPPPNTRSLLDTIPEDGDRPFDWFFSGQVNHARRDQLVDAVAGLPGGKLNQTGGFTKGFARGDYLAETARAKIIPSPSGPSTPDAFRLWEAIEAGCLPVADRRCPAYPADNYWRFLLGDDPPFPTVSEWSELPAMLPGLLAGWPANTNRVGSWWTQYQRDLRRRVAADIADVSRCPADTPNVTVLIPTSPVPAHPETGMIEQTVGSVRYHHPDADVLILVDGVRSEHEHRRSDYETYQQRLLWLARHRWRNVTVVRFDDHQHQANMVRHALTTVDTPLVLFVEHDTPLVTDEPIDWQACSAPILDDELDVVRFHYEAVIPAEHWPLMIDQDAPVLVGGCRVIRTRQFSARPHLASTEWYRQSIADHFPETCRTFVEDRMHGVCQAGRWGRNRLAIYAPDVTNLKRSLNLDGRGDDKKAECVFS